MQRVDTLIKKLQEQHLAKAPVSHLIVTVQILLDELVHVKNMSAPEEKTAITVDIPQTILPKPEESHPEKYFEVLQVNEAELEAELEEIKKNADAISKISVQNKPQIIFEEQETKKSVYEPKHSYETRPSQENNLTKREINETLISQTTSIHDNLKQTDLDLGGSFSENHIKDLKKAIGINDRFLFISHLFRGDETMYERSIKTINSFSILPEAEYWIQRELKTKLGWNDTDEVVKQFNQLVRRRFL